MIKTKYLKTRLIELGSSSLGLFVVVVALSKLAYMVAWIVIYIVDSCIEKTMIVVYDGH